MRCGIRLLAIGCLVVWALASSSAAAPPPLTPALAAYLAGLDALTQGKFNDAAAAFSRALETAGDDPTFVPARGVALTLGEQFPQALRDLERAR
jgi:Flp pilus assembly protein TadD